MIGHLIAVRTAELSSVQRAARAVSGSYRDGARDNWMAAAVCFLVQDAHNRRRFAVVVPEQAVDAVTVELFVQFFRLAIFMGVALISLG